MLVVPLLFQCVCLRVPIRSQKPTFPTTFNYLVVASDRTLLYDTTLEAAAKGSPTGDAHFWKVIRQTESKHLVFLFQDLTQWENQAIIQFENSRSQTCPVMSLLADAKNTGLRLAAQYYFQALQKSIHRFSKDLNCPLMPYCIYADQLHTGPISFQSSFICYCCKDTCVHEGGLRRIK